MPAANNDLRLVRSYLPVLHFGDDDGFPLSGGTLCTYVAGTNTPIATYADKNGTPNPVKVPLDGRGECVAWLEAGRQYKFVVLDRFGDVKITTDYVTISAEMPDGGDVTKAYVDEQDALETARAQAAEAAAKTEVVQGENCTIEKTTAADGHDVYTVNADGKPQVQSDWSRADSSAVDYIKNKPNLTLKENVANKTETVRQSGSADNTHYPSEAAVRSAIDSAVAAAYKAAGTKRAAELTSSLLVAANEGNVYNITEAGTTDVNFVDGAGKTINVGDNVGVCKVGNDYKFDLLSGFVDLSNYVQKSNTAGLLKNDGTVDTSDYLAKTGDGSNVTITPDGSSGTTFSSGDKLSALAQKFINLVSSLKALAFKATVGTSDIADDAITAAKVKDNETLPVNISGNATSATNLAPGGTSGQYLKSNGSGNAPSWANSSDMTAGIAYNLPFGYVVLANTPSSGNAPANAGVLCEIVPDLTGTSGYFAELDVFVTQINRVYAHCKVRMFMRCDMGEISYRSWVIWEKPNPTNISVTVRRSTSSKKFFLCAKGASGTYAGCYAVLRSASDMYANISKSLPNWVKMYPNADLENIDYLIDDTTESNKVGSASQPVYVDTDGSVKECGFQVNFGTPIAGANVLNIITA